MEVNHDAHYKVLMMGIVRSLQCPSKESPEGVGL